MKIALATVAFSGDLALLRLQARSISRHFDPDDLAAIHIIINDPAADDVRAVIENIVLAEFDFAQSFSRLVKVVDGRALWRAPMGTGGWIWQQAMKLRIAGHVETPFYVALDAKNHFVRPVSLRAFVTADGKANTLLTRKRGENYCWAVASYGAFGFRPDEIPKYSMPTITPFTLEKALVQDMIATLETCGDSLEVLLARHAGAWTEFFLYQAYILRRFGSYEARCAPVPRQNYATLFSAWPPNDERLTAEIELAFGEDVLSFGLHRARLATLSSSHRGLIRALWRERGLVRDDEDLSWIFPDRRQD